MNAIDELSDLGLSFDPEPPLRDARRPLAMVFRADPSGGSFQALAALEVERFDIQASKNGAGDSDWTAYQVAWQSAVEALARLRVQHEIWHVLATRRPAGLDGAALRTGWVLLGRGPTAHEAAAAAERAYEDAATIFKAFTGFATTRPVVSAEALLDLLRPAAAPFVRALRKKRWEPDLAVGVSAGLILPWRPGPIRWAPLVDALAARPSDAAFVVRVRTNVTPPPEAITQAERDAMDIQNEFTRVLGSRTRDVTILQSDESYARLLTAASDRVLVLRQPCLAVDVCLATWEDPGPALTALAEASLGSRAHLDAEDIVPDATPVGCVDLSPGALLEALDVRAAPELLVSAAEAWALVRTPEPPEDERTPLAASRSRFLSLRSTPASGTALGHGERYGRPCEARLDDEARRRHVYVVGQTGTGKSTLLLNLILPDLQAGHGVTVLDPHGSLIADVLARMPKERAGDVILVDPAADRFVPLNPLAIDSDDPLRYIALRDLVIEEFLDTFDALYDMRHAGGPMFELYFRAFVSLLMGSRRPTDYTPNLLMVEIAMANKDLQRALQERIAADDALPRNTIASFRAISGDASLSNMLPYITSKIVRFCGPATVRRMLCQPRCLDFDGILRDRKIVLVDTSPARIGKESSALIARQIIMRLGVAAMQRGADKRLPPHFIYADEFHNFATERFANLLSEARKFGIGLVLAHQYSSQLVRGADASLLDAVLGNVGTVVAFRMGSKDADLLERAMAPRVSATDIVGLPNYAAFVRSSGGLGNVPFTLRTRPAPPEDPERAALVRELALLKYALDRDSVDEEIRSSVEAFRSVTGTAGA